MSWMSDVVWSENFLEIFPNVFLLQHVSLRFRNKDTEEVIYIRSLHLQLLSEMVTLLPPNPHTQTPESLYDHFSVNPSTGLSTKQVEQHTSQYGKNGQYPSLAPFASSIIEHVVTLPFLSLFWQFYRKTLQNHYGNSSWNNSRIN